MRCQAVSSNFVGMLKNEVFLCREFFETIFTKCFGIHVTIKPPEQVGGALKVGGTDKSFRRTARAGSAGGCCWVAWKEHFFRTGDGERSGGETPTANVLCCAACRLRPGATPARFQFHRRTQSPGLPGGLSRRAVNVGCRHHSTPCQPEGGCWILLQPGDAHANHLWPLRVRPPIFGRSPRSWQAVRGAAPAIGFWASACPFRYLIGGGRDLDPALPAPFPFRDCGPMNSRQYLGLPLPHMINDIAPAALARGLG